MKTITICFTYEQLEYIFNFGQHFKFDKNQFGWMQNMAQVFISPFENCPPETTGLTVFTGNMYEFCVHEMKGVMEREIVYLIQEMQQIALCGQLDKDYPSHADSFDSLCICSSIIKQIKEALRQCE